VWREDLQRELVLALRPIQCGDEITVTYKQRYQVQERSTRLTLHDMRK